MQRKTYLKLSAKNYTEPILLSIVKKLNKISLHHSIGQHNLIIKTFMKALTNFSSSNLTGAVDKV